MHDRLAQKVKTFECDLWFREWCDGKAISSSICLWLESVYLSSWPWLAFPQSQSLSKNHASSPQLFQRTKIWLLCSQASILHIGHHSRRTDYHNHYRCLVVPVETWVASVEIQMAVFVDIPKVVFVGIFVVFAESLIAFLVHRVVPRVPAERLQLVTCQSVETLQSVDSFGKISVDFRG